MKTSAKHFGLTVGL